MVVKIPIQVEPVTQVRCQSLDAQGLRGVMPRVDQVETPLNGIEVGMVRALTSNEGIEFRLASLGQHVSGGPSNDADPNGSFRATGDQGGASFQRVEHPVQLQRQSLPGGKAAGHLAQTPMGIPR